MFFFRKRHRQRRKPTNPAYVVVIFCVLILLLPITFYLIRRPSGAQAAWYNTGGTWTYRKQITIDHTKVSGSSDLSSFPVLISLSSDSDLNANAQADGDDILFTSADGTTKLDHEIEKYSSGTLVAWVRIPTLSASVDTVIYLYYGNGAASNQENVAAVWDSNYVAVYHLAENPGASAPQMLNSETNSNQGTTTGMVSGNLVAGKVGDALNFDGSNDAVFLTDNLSGSTFTLQAWIRPDTNYTGSGWYTLFQRTDTGSWFDFQLYAYAQDSSPPGRSVLRTDWNNNNTIDANEHVESAAAPAQNTWLFINASYDGSNMRLYRNGSTTADNTTACASCTLTDSNNPITIGENTAWGELFDGLMDEVRVSNIARSADWMATEYNNQNSPGTFYTLAGQATEAPAATNTPTPIPTPTPTPTPNPNAGAGDPPLAYWSFDDSSGMTAQDSTINNSDITLPGSTNTPTWQQQDFCISGSCLKFDGSNDYASAADTTPLRLTNTGTVQAWIRPNTLPTSGNYSVILNKGNWGAGRNYYAVYYSGTGGTLRFDLGDSNSTNALSSVPSSVTPLNQWSHITMTWDGSTIRAYINGQQVGATAQVDIPDTSTYSFLVGGHSGSYPFNGTIDEVKVYGYARTADQIKADFTAHGSTKGSAVQIGSQTEESSLSHGLMGYWPMNETAANSCGSSNDTCDYSGNANHGDWAGNTTATTGKIAGGTTYDGTGDATTLADVLDSDYNQPLTLAAWVKTSSNGPQSIITKQDSSSPFRGYNMQFGSSGYLYFQLIDTYSTSTLEVRSAADLNYYDGVWHHVVAAYDGTALDTGVRLFFDGNPITTFTTLNNLSGTTTNNLSLYLGSRNGTQQFLNGQLDEARIYNRVLSPVEVKNLYRWTPGPIGYWPMDEGQDNTCTGGTNDVCDRSGNGINGANTNGPTWTGGKFGKALQFDGTNDYVDIGSGPSLIHTVTFWVKPATTTEYFINLTNATDYIWSNSGTVTATGVLSPTIYVNGLRSSTLTAGVWQHVAIVSATAENANNLDFGRTQDTNYLEGQLDDIRMYNYVRTQSQIIEDMNAGHPVGGSPVGSQLAYWNFDEMQGQTANDSGATGGYNGTRGATASVNTDDPSWRTADECKTNGCLYFDGGDFITTPYTPALGTNAITFSTWFKAPNANQSGMLISKRLNASPFTQLSLGIFSSCTGAGGQALTAMEIGGSRCIVSSEDVADNQWHHAVLVRSATEFTLYLDGRVIGTDADAATNLTNTSPIRIGDGNGNYQFTGHIDEVKVYSTALTQEEILIDMNANAAINLGATANAEAATITDGAGNPPVGYWNFDEKRDNSCTGGTNDLRDRSANASDGANSGGPQWVRGKMGSALKFDGVDDAVSLGQPTPLVFTGAMTVEAWVKVDGLTNNGRFIAKQGGGAARSWTLNMENGATNYFSFGIASNASTSIDVENSSPPAGDEVVVGEWAHIVGVYQPSQYLRLYKNGRLIAENTTSIPASQFVANSLPIVIGNRPDGLTPFNGVIDEIKIYNYARTPAQIAYDYNRGEPIGYWQFDECSGTIANDASGNGNNGAIEPGDATGDNDTVGSCNSGNSTEMWNDGTTGKYNGSLGFDGTNDYVDLGTAVGNYTDNFTISSWFKTSTNNTRPAISRRDNTTGCQYDTYIRSGSGVLSFYDCSTEHYGTRVVTDGNWHHGVWVINGANSRIYLDGKLETTFSPSITTQANTKAIIGAFGNSGGSAVMNGQIDDVRLYNYPLSASQVLKIYNQNAGVRFGP